MRFTQKGIIGIVATIVIVVLAGGAIGYLLVTRSFPKISGTVYVQGPLHEIKVYRDEYGVPHIRAQSEYDAFFAVGYTQAQDRLWQMDLMRRAGSGRLSEVLGESALKIDKMFRTLGLWKHAQKLSRFIDDDTRKALQAYADGVNQFILTHAGKYPIEFDMLQIEPEQWTVEHSLLVSRLMAWELNYSRWVDLLLAELVQRFGEERAKEIFPYWPEDAPCIIPPELKGKLIAENLRSVFDAEGEYRSLMGFRALESGSNAWAVAGKKSVTGKPILANDPHLLLMAPGRWYEIHISTPTFDVAGMSIPGVPFVVAGRNQRVAWGVTNAMMDDNDYYVEEVDSLQHPTRYKLNNEWRPITEVVDTIMVKGSLPVILSVYSTYRGPIVNKMEPTAQSASTLISMHWVGYEISNEAGAFYRMSKATNWQEFQDALKLFAVPAQNFVYADVDGNIGYRTGGRIPIRKTKGPTLPFPGWTDEYDWKGFVPFDQMPHVFNPPEGFIATANNKIIDDTYPYHISSHWESPWRSIRIHEALHEQEKYSMDDMQRLQFDLLSVQARDFLPYILHAYDSVAMRDPDVKTMLEYFQTWNFEMRKEDVSTTLFQATLTKMVYNAFHDKMGERLYGLYDTLASTPLSALSHLLKNPDSEWFDDWKTPERETRDDCIRKSVSDALNDLKTRLGGELKEWQWGRLHAVTFEHVFGANKLLSSLFNVGPFPIGGSHATVNVGQYFLAHPYESAVGPSMRQIFNLADVNDTRTILPPGQSGQVFSEHYKDQVMLWLYGGYKIRPMQIDLVESTCKNVLLLEPLP
jgi:penicillin G amidase